MKSIHAWLAEYSVSHRNADNKRLHQICVPLIVIASLGMLRAIPVGNHWLNACSLAVLAMVAYYALLSWRLALGMAVLLGLTGLLIEVSHDHLGSLHLPLMVAIFVISWVGQFIGHRIEGMKPSFFKDLQFLLIGPLWLLADLYKALSLRVGHSQPA